MSTARASVRLCYHIQRDQRCLLPVRSHGGPLVEEVGYRLGAAEEDGVLAEHGDPHDVACVQQRHELGVRRCDVLDENVSPYRLWSSAFSSQRLGRLM